MPAPIGNQNAAKGRKWSAAIERAIAKRYGKALVDALDDLADKFIEAVEKGDLAAFKELGDRIDGKPAQVLQGDPDNPLAVEMIERRIVDPKA